MTEEIWKDIKGYEGYYQVSNFGRVRSIDTEIDAYNYNAKRNIKYIRKGRILKVIHDKDGYCTILLSKKNIKSIYKIHRLVAQAFLSNPCNLPEINHKDENKDNNRIDNLEWCTHQYNNTYLDKHIRGGLKLKNGIKSKEVLQLTLNGELIATYPSVREAERLTGFHHGNISNCICGKLKTYKGFLWQYKNRNDMNIGDQKMVNQ